VVGESVTRKQLRMPTTCGTVSVGSWPESSIGEDSAVEVKFGFAFDIIPNIVVQLAALDAASPPSKRVDAWASDAGVEGFRLHVRTWEDSITYAAKVSWVASSEPAAVQLGVLTLGDGAGRRLSDSEERSVSFNSPFPCKPNVALGFAALDAQGEQHLRVRSECLDINSRSFALRAGSWASSVTRSARMSWIATASPAVLQCGTVKIGSWPNDALCNGDDRFVDVAFERAFDRSPSVALGLVCVDASCRAHTRVDTWADHVRRVGFRLHVRSWEDSITWRVAVSWVATPVVPSATASSMPPHQPPREYVVDGPPLGQGWWGVTHRVKHSVDGHVYAVKTCRHPFSQHEQALRQELANLTRLPVHCNLLRYFHCTVQADRLHIVTEYLDAFKFTELVPGPDGSNKEKHVVATVLRWMMQLCDGLAHLHEASMVHRDLHGDNILVEKSTDGTPSVSHRAVRIIDFGAAGVYSDAECPRLMSRDAGCWRYFSPERRSGCAFDGRDDVWAVGCHLTEMLSGRLIHKRENCGIDGVDFSQSPEAVQLAVQDCHACDTSGRCGQAAQALLSLTPELRPRAAGARDAVGRLLEFVPGKRSLGGVSSSTPSNRRRRCVTRDASCGGTPTTAWRRRSCNQQGCAGQRVTCT